MLRALSVRRAPRGYEPLVDETSVALLGGKLERARSVPARILRSPGKKQELNFPGNSPAKPSKSVNKSHPLFSLFCARRKKKTTAKPEFSRYLEYVKEGGMWDLNSNMPVMHYK